MQIEVGSVSRRLTKRGRVWRTDDGEPRVVAELGPVEDSRTLVWDGRVEGAPAPPGIYLIEVTARDRAANLGTAPREVPPRRPPRGRPGLTIRSIAAEAPMRPVTSGQKLRVNVDARGRPYRWRLRRVGTTKPVANGREGPRQPVELTAPGGDSGLYVLELTAGRHKTAVPVMVQSRERAVMLVVVPTLTWTATAQVDEDADGIPNTLDAGTPVPWPRVLDDGLPEDLLAARGAAARPARPREDPLRPHQRPRPRALARAARVGPQGGPARRLRALDHARLRPAPAPLRARGRPAGQLRRREHAPRRHHPAQPRQVDAGRLVRPTQPSIQDPFGTRFEDVRSTGDGARSCR